MKSDFYLFKRRPGQLRARRVCVSCVVGLALLLPATMTFAGPDTRRPPVRDVVSGPWAAFAPAVTKTRALTLVVGHEGRDIALATLIDHQGHLLTKASELPEQITDDQPLYVRRSSLEARARGDMMRATVLGTDRATDLALLHVEGLEPPVADAGDGLVVPPTLPGIGSWLITVAPAREPIAVGIVSVEPRPIPRRRVLLGVELAPDGVDDRAGTRVRNVIPGMGAAEAGLQRGDVITHVADQPTANREDILAKLRELDQGDAIDITIRRGDEAMNLTIRLAYLPESPADRLARMNRMGGALSERAHGFERVIQHDTVLQPHHMGGPVVNLDGQVVGINIARAGRIASYALPIDLVLEAADRLKVGTEPVSTTPDLTQ